MQSKKLRICDEFNKSTQVKKNYFNSLQVT